MQNYILLATLRVNNNLSQPKICHILNINLRTYKMYEAGDIIININDLNKISNFYNVSINSLVNLTNNLQCDNFNKDINYNFLAFSLKLVRIKAKLNQKEFANLFHISISTLSKYENNPQNIKISYLYEIAKKYHISIDYMCGKTLTKEIF